MRANHQRVLLLSLFCSNWLPCHADDIIVDKIYHPYVQPLEQSLEWRAIYQDKQAAVADNTQLHQFSYGRSLNEHWFAEFYIITNNSSAQNLEVEAYEIETKWQLAEQGEYWADLGILFELEKEANINVWEFSSALLVEKEWGKWSGTANLYIVNEWGDDIQQEVETKLNLQARYRYSRAFEPAIEMYNGENTKALGPAVLGQFKFGNKTRLHWEVGILFGLDTESPDNTVRMLAELEF